jgi:hypothetical protein
MFPKKKTENFDFIKYELNQCKNGSFDNLEIKNLQASNIKQFILDKFEIPKPKCYFQFDKEPAFIFSEPRRIHGSNDLCMITTSNEKRFIPLPHTFIRINTIHSKESLIWIEIDLSQTSIENNLRLSSDYEIEIHIGESCYSVKKWSLQLNPSSHYICIQWQDIENGLWEKLETDTLPNCFVYVKQPKNIFEWINYINRASKQTNGGYISNNETQPSCKDVKSEYLFIIGNDNINKITNGNNYFLNGIGEIKIGITENEKKDENNLCSVSFIPSFLLDSKDNTVWTNINLKSKWTNWNLQSKTNVDMEIWLDPKIYQNSKELQFEINKTFNNCIFSEKKLMVFSGIDHDYECIIPSGYHTILDIKEYVNKFLFENSLGSTTIDFDFIDRKWIIKCKTPMKIQLGTLGSWMNFNTDLPFIGKELKGKSILSYLTFNDPFKSEGKNLKSIVPFFNDINQTYAKYLIHPGLFQHYYQCIHNEIDDSLEFKRIWSRWITYDKDLSFANLFSSIKMPQKSNLFEYFQFNLNINQSLIVENKDEIQSNEIINRPSLKSWYLFQSLFIPNLFPDQLIPITHCSLSDYIFPSKYIYISLKPYQSTETLISNKIIINNDIAWENSSVIKLKKTLEGNYKLHKSHKQKSFEKSRIRPDINSFQLLNQFGNYISFGKGVYKLSFQTQSSFS